MKVERICWFVNNVKRRARRWQAQLLAVYIGIRALSRPSPLSLSSRLQRQRRGVMYTLTGALTKRNTRDHWTLGWEFVERSPNSPARAPWGLSGVPGELPRASAEYQSPGASERVEDRRTNRRRTMYIRYAYAKVGPDLRLGSLQLSLPQRAPQSLLQPNSGFNECSSERRRTELALSTPTPPAPTDWQLMIESGRLVDSLACHENSGGPTRLDHRSYHRASLKFCVISSLSLSVPGKLDTETFAATKAKLEAAKEKNGHNLLGMSAGWLSS